MGLGKVNPLVVLVLRPAALEQDFHQSVRVFGLSSNHPINAGGNSTIHLFLPALYCPSERFALDYISSNVRRHGPQFGQFRIVLPALIERRNTQARQFGGILDRQTLRKTLEKLLLRSLGVRALF